MANKQTAPKEKAPAVTQQKAPQQKQPTVSAPLLFERSNYLIMIGGVLIIMLGFLLMSGGATTDPAVFPKDEIYSFTRIGLAPIVIMIGFGFEIYAILKRPKSQ
jgi:hypothetical protein